MSRQNVPGEYGNKSRYDQSCGTKYSMKFSIKCVVLGINNGDDKCYEDVISNVGTGS